MARTDAEPLSRRSRTVIGRCVLTAGILLAVRPSSAFVTVNGARLNYLDWGGHGTGMVFIHGLGDSPHAYDEIAPKFRGRFRVIAYARRAHGQSQVVGPYTHGVLGEDLRLLLDSLKIQKAVLVGWSLGGNELAEFTAAHPERVAGLVFLECYDLSRPEIRSLLTHYPLGSSPSRPSEPGGLSSLVEVGVLAQCP